MSANEPIHEITWTLKHKHFMRLSQADFDEIAQQLHMPDGVANDDIIAALYEDRDASEVLAELSSDRNWMDSDDAEMVLDNVYRGDHS